MGDFFLAPQYVIARLTFDCSLAILYFIAFLSAFNQFPALLGSHGLLPAPDFLLRKSFRSSPSIFHWKYSDTFLRVICLIGMSISIFLMASSFFKIPVFIHMLSWLMIYALYLSIVNVGQEFYGFGWETMILEAGFFAAFMGPHWITPSWIPILVLRWMLFRTEMGAGLIKLRGDPCWRDLTCLYYHHETQPLPNPLSRYFHFAPKLIHRAGVVFSHFCQVIAPISLFLPQPWASAGGCFLIFHQLILVISGNYSWLNWLTIVLGLLCFHDGFFGKEFETLPAPEWFGIIQLLIGVFALILSYRPCLNLFSPTQFMNYCWNRWHLVGAYGAFGSVSKERYEVVLEGTNDDEPHTYTKWLEYGFKGKPVELDRLPPVVAPYHLRLDWMIWFLPFSVLVGQGEIYVQGHSVWFVRLLQKLLNNDLQTLKLFRKNPFPDSPPKWIRAQFYQYHYVKPGGQKIWKRKLLGTYCPPVSRAFLESILK